MNISKKNTKTFTKAFSSVFIPKPIAYNIKPNSSISHCDKYFLKELYLSFSFISLLNND